MKWMALTIRVILSSFLAVACGVFVLGAITLCFGQMINNVVIGYWQWIPGIGAYLIVSAAMLYAFRWAWRSTLY